jgi:hypothetical protein
MTIIFTIQLIMLLVVAACIVIVFQIGLLWRIFRSWAWILKLAAYLTMGTLQVWRYLALSSALMDAKARGVMPEHLTASQWGNMALTFLFFGLIIISYDVLRRDLRKIGVGV